jgi:phosphoribosylformimino-5-aminoimidazole carboxamide ribotide isomerase
MITIIPAIDIIEGKCVRLTRGDYDTKKVYNEDPLEVAKRFEGIGIKRLHLVDLDGAKEKKIISWKILEKISGLTCLKIDFGGGIQTDHDLYIAFESGADQVTAGSIAVKNKPIVISWIKKYGQEKIILGADVNKKKIAIHGWTEKTDLDLFDFVEEYHNEGIKYLICTDIAKDGMLTGPSIELYQELKSEFQELFIIASGGISKLEEIEELNSKQIDGVIIGKAIYEGKIKVEELKQFLC